jgi:gluconate 2-dehydrogenase gamma chain
MTRPRTINRREFVAEVVWASMGASLVVLGGCQSRRSSGSGSAKPEAPPDAAPRFFTAVELATLGAACERILPRDTEPNALDLGVPNYIDRALSDDLMVNWREPMRTGLADLEAEARHRGGVAFPALGGAEQDDLLLTVQKETRGRTGFFTRLFHLTMEGAFGDPLRGGNRDGAGWKLLGFTPDPCSPGPLAQLGRKK